PEESLTLLPHSYVVTAVASAGVALAVSPRLPVGRAALVAAVAAVALAAALLVPRVVGSSGPTAADRRAADAYAAAVKEPGRQGGRVVVEEIRPSLSDLELGHMS